MDAELTFSDVVDMIRNNHEVDTGHKIGYAEAAKKLDKAIEPIIQNYNDTKQAIQAHIDKKVNEANKELFEALRGIWSNPPKEYVEQGSNELYWNRTSLLKILDTLEAEWENSNA